MQNGRISLKKVDGRIQALVSDMFMNISFGLQSTELVVRVSVWHKSFRDIIFGHTTSSAIVVSAIVDLATPFSYCSKGS